MLTSHGRNHNDVTYFNVTPAPHTLPILEAKGARPILPRVLCAVPVLSASASPDGARVKLVAPEIWHDKDLQPFEKELTPRGERFASASASEPTMFVVLRSRPPC
jgi:hypothetical protein